MAEALHRRVLLARSVAVMSAPAALGACETLTRQPAVPRERTAQASVLGLPNERFYFLTDPLALDREFQAALQRYAAFRQLRPGTAIPPVSVLAVSGGGEDGAFGAGLLCGWTTTGARPEFGLVTGVSTGALTAPFAFLGPESQRAAAAAVCADEQDTFWPFHDTLYANQHGENQGAFSDDRLRAMAEKVGLDMPTFNTCLDDAATAGAVAASTASGRDQGVNATPWLTVNGTRVENWQDWSALSAAIEAAAK